MSNLEREFSRAAKNFKIEFTTRHMTLMFLAHLESLPKKKVKEALVDIIPDRSLVRPMQTLFIMDKEGCMLLLRDIVKRQLEYMYRYKKNDFDDWYKDAEEAMKEFEGQSKNK